MDLLDRPLSELPFIVVDVETTGFWPRNDRIVEVAIAHSSGGVVEGLLIDTLVDPGRDVGPTHIHGVTAEMVRGAPRFSQVAPAVATALRRGIVVGHNLPFDLRFLDAEVTSAGVGPLFDLPRVCTMALTRRLFKGESWSYKLQSLCARFGLTNRQAHSAAGDALVTAQLLGLLLAEATHQGVRTLGDLVRVGGTRVPTVPIAYDAPLPPVPQQPRTRVAGALEERRGSFMSRLVEQRLDGSRHDGHEQLDTYLELLDRILRDRIIDLREQELLTRVVAEWNLGGVDLGRAHRIYLEGLVDVAWSDGILTDAEREDLERVADLFAIPRCELAGIRHSTRQPEAAPAHVVKSVGDGRSICMTGAFAGPRGGGMSRHQVEAYAERAGFHVLKGVTKKLDLLVVADPNTCSGKARKARQYGIEIVAEPVFWRELGLA